MEIERKKEKKERQVSEKQTPFNIREEKSKEAAEARENNPALMALYSLFFPGTGNRGMGKFITDKFGNRILRIKAKEKVKDQNA